ncbi:MAG: DinB family protein [Candidatus Omnitrophica bacterium]|nr:DinB family protein [Candidatus Omnitrophota bacterium]
MNLIDPFIQEFEMETANTRKVLERVPEDRFSYRPHEKSYTMCELASHIANSLEWTRETVDKDVFEMDPEQYKPFIAESNADLLETFDKNVAMAKEKLATCSNESLLTMWQMKVGGKVALEMPRMAVLRFFILNHMIHHRGQLDVYLRMNDVPLPQVYGPTADEPGMVGG